MVFMPFGKYRGAALEDLPDDYVAWLHGLPDLREPLRRAVHAEWSLRFGATASALPALAAEARPAAEELISVGLRALVRQHHPDRGGETSAMQKINAAAAWLRQAVRAA
jgi:Putative quorum-sensing-regulated virulence factor